MLINTASLSSLYDMYKQTALTPFNRAGQVIITRDMWNQYWEIQTKGTNYVTDSREGEPFWKNVTLACLDLMDHVGSYMVGEFDALEDKHIQEIWKTLIKSWYFGKVWVIKSEEVRDLEIALAESKMYRDNVPENKILRDNPFRLFEKYEVKNGKHVFKSLLTGIEGFELDPKEMIYLSLNEGINFRKWWKINMEFVSGKSRIVDATKALSKTVQVIVRNAETYRIERQQIENPSVFFELRRQTGTAEVVEQNLYQSMPIIDGQRIKDMMDIIHSMYEKECELMGFTMNSNDKKERLTVAENYKDLRRITNIQDYQLKSLKIFEEQLKDRGWVEDSFKIEISGLTYAQGLPDTVLPAEDVIEFGDKPKTEQELSKSNAE